MENLTLVLDVVLVGAASTDPADTIRGGPMLLAAGLAAAAGAVSFASPCVVPLVPGYISYLIGLVGGEGQATGPGDGRRPRIRAVAATAWFVAGFTAVFLLQAVLVLGVANSLITNQTLLTRIGGLVTITMGLAMLGLFRPLQRERRLSLRPTGRRLGPVLLGGVFALGWTVCIGPTLAGVLSMAWATEWNGTAWRGLVLVVAYCAGLGVPFLLVAWGFGWASTAITFLRRHSRTIQVIGATMMITVGVLMLTGLWGQFLAWLQVRLAETGTVPLL